MPEGLSRDVAKEALKEALKEWLDEQFAAFGKWTAAALASVLLGGALYVVVTYRINR
jgi:hypothetical protein